MNELERARMRMGVNDYEFTFTVCSVDLVVHVEDTRSDPAVGIDASYSINTVFHSDEDVTPLMSNYTMDEIYGKVAETWAQAEIERKGFLDAKKRGVSCPF